MLADDERLGGNFDAEVPAPEATDSPRRPAAGARSPSRSSTDLPKTLKSVISGPTRAAGADAPAGVFCFVFRVSSTHLLPSLLAPRATSGPVAPVEVQVQESQLHRISHHCLCPDVHRLSPAAVRPVAALPGPRRTGAVTQRCGSPGVPTVGTAGRDGRDAGTRRRTACLDGACSCRQEKNASPFRFTPPSPARPAPAPRSAGRRWPPWPRT